MKWRWCTVGAGLGCLVLGALGLRDFGGLPAEQPGPTFLRGVQGVILTSAFLAAGVSFLLLSLPPGGLTGRTLAGRGRRLIAVGLFVLGVHLAFWMDEGFFLLALLLWPAVLVFLALGAVAWVAGRKNMTLLICEVVKNKDMSLRRYAIGALGYIGDKRAIPTLESILKAKDEIYYFRGDALYSIYQIDRVLGKKYAKEYGREHEYLPVYRKVLRKMKRG